MKGGYPEDIIGLKFGLLTVEYKCELPKKNSYHCKCECGREIDLCRWELTSHRVRSCGKCKNACIQTGDSKTKFYLAYRHMKDRCYNPKNKSYHHYGGRGIKVCDRWLESYLNFKDDMYESYLKHINEFGEGQTTLDRIDVNENYCPENCRWATYREQILNRRNTRYETVDGVTKPLSEHIKDRGLNERTVYYRLKHGLSVEDALSIPTGQINCTLYGDMSLRKYCIENELPYKTILHRIRNGMSIELAINIPIDKRFSHSKNNKNSLDNGE